MKKSLSFAAFSAAFGLLSSAASAAAVDSAQLAASVKQAVAANPSATTRIVTAEVSKHPNLSCEIVRAAIQGSQADSYQVASIVRAASAASPDNTRLIAQCAVASAPDSLTSVQAVLSGAPAAAEESFAGAAPTPLASVSVPVSQSGTSVPVTDPVTISSSSEKISTESYLYYNESIRLGRIIPTSNPNRMLVVSEEGTKVGEIVASNEDVERRKTVNALLRHKKWFYTGWIPDGGSIESYPIDPFNQMDYTIGDKRNPLHIPGSRSGPSGIFGVGGPASAQQPPATHATTDIDPPSAP